MEDRGQKIHQILADGSVWDGSTSVTPLAIRYIVDSGDTLIYYLGRAAVGSGTGSAVWQLQRMTYSATTDDVIVEWADGNSDFDNIFDNREALSYS